MDQYSWEKWRLASHQSMIRAAETRSRLDGWRPRERFAVRLAVALRRLADRLDGGVPVRPWLVRGRRLGSD
jgi:plasmid stabilization system protein ParE